MRTWDKSKPPTGPFSLNRDAPQAENLVAWYPLGGAGKLWVPDYVGPNHLTLGTDPGLTVGQAGAPVLPLVAASSQYLEGVIVGASALPLTLAGWCNTTSTGSLGVPICVATNGGNARLQIQKDSSARQIGAAIVDSSGSGNTISFTTSSLYTDNVDFHAAAVYTSSTSRQAFLNGIGSSVDTLSITASGMNRVLLGGRRNSSSVGAFWGGHIGEWGVWAQADDAAMIALRADPGKRFELWYPLRNKRWISLGAGPVTHTTTGTLATAGAAVAGTAARFRAFATTGVLAPTGAAVVGTAARAGGGPTTHDGTGALATTGAVVAGTAARFRAFATTGVLASAGAEVAGSATRFRAFATSGVLANAGAAVTGSATRFRTFGTSGALATAGATITGVSLRYRTMGSSGALVTAGATVAGTAARFRAHGTSGALAAAGASITGSALRLTPGGGVYPDPADVRAGVIYGPTGAEFTGTMSILLDLNTGRLVKIIGQKVALLL